MVGHSPFPNLIADRDKESSRTSIVASPPAWTSFDGPSTVSSESVAEIFLSSMNTNDGFC